MTGPGSILWLLRHELRVSWRRMGARRGRGGALWVRLAFLIGVPAVLALLIGAPLGVWLRRHEVAITPEAAAVAAVGAAALFTLMLSQTLTVAVEALYQRGDLELMFSSPLNPRTVMAVRFLAVAVDCFSVFAYFLAGPLVAIALLVKPVWLAGLVVLFALALAAAGTGLFLASALFRAIGPRRTRTAAQLLAALIGAAFFLVAQTRNILGRGPAESVMAQAMRLARETQAQLPGLDWPLRAMLGEPLPLLAAVALGGGVFGLANAVLGPRFAADAAAAAGAGSTRRPARSAVAAFASGAFAATLRKELRLLWRDPALVTQVLMRVLYMLPLGVLLLRQAGEGSVLLMPGSAAALSLVAGQVAASLAWITVSAEDAPDLLASAPAPVALVRQGKLAAAALPPALMLAPVLIPLTVLAPLVGVVATAGCAAAMASAALINVWWQRPARRSEFRKRRAAAWFVTVAEIAVGVSIAGATGLFAAGLAWGVVPAVLAVGIFLALRRSDAQIAEALRAAA